MLRKVPMESTIYIYNIYIYIYIINVIIIHQMEWVLKLEVTVTKYTFCRPSLGF